MKLLFALSTIIGCAFAQQQEVPAAPPYCPDTGSANAIVCSTTLGLANYTKGQTILVNVAAANTTATTINLNNLGSKNVTKNGNAALTGGELSAGGIYLMSYDGLEFVLNGGTPNGTVFLNGGTNVIAAALAANTTIRITAATTQSVALAITQAHVKLVCDPDVVLTLSTTSSIITDTGDYLDFSGCIIDGNSQNTASAPIVINANHSRVHGLVSQNMGTNASDGEIKVTGGLDNHVYDNKLIGVDRLIYLNPSAAVIDSPYVEENYLQQTTVGGAIVMQSGTNGLLHPFIIHNTIRTATRCVYLFTGAAGLVHDIHWSSNDCLLNGTSGDEGYSTYGAIAGEIDGNIMDDTGFSLIGSNFFGLHDLAEVSITRNNCHATGNQGSCFTLLDTQRVTMTGNVIGGGILSSGVVSNGFAAAGIGIDMVQSAGTVNSGGNIIANNTIVTPLSFTGKAIRAGCFGANTGSTCSGDIIADNYIFASGGTCIEITTSASNTNASSQTEHNHLEGCTTGITVDSGVTNARIGNNEMIGVTTEISDAGTATHFEPQCHVYNISNSTTNLAVTQDGGPATLTTKLGALTQSLPLFTMSPLMVITGYTIKTVTAFTGTATLVSTFGDSSGPSPTAYSSNTFNLQTAAGPTIFQDPSGGGVTLPKHVTEAGSNTFNLVLTSTTQNISSISAGSVDARVCWEAP